MLATLIPLFNDKTEVAAYSLFAQKENKLISPKHMGTASLDGAGRVSGLDIIENIGLDNMMGDRDVFLELNQFSIFSDLEKDCKAPAERIVFLIDVSIGPTDANIARIKQLKEAGFRFALKKLALEQVGTYAPILAKMSFILFDHNKINIKIARPIIQKTYPDLKIVAVDVATKEEFERLTKDGSFDLYEGDFFRMPVKEAGVEISPMKVTYIELLNVVNNPDFDLSDVADVIGHDTALVMSLLEMANRLSVNSEITSIRHAAAMIGQKELKKWINSAVTKELCVDRPSEITRISLIRARFCENLAKSFDMAVQAEELFLMGLFSVLDVILDKPMEEALSLVNVSRPIQEALIDHTGPLSHVLNFVFEYENARWQEVSRLIIMDDLDTDRVYEDYVESLAWFKELFN